MAEITRLQIPIRVKDLIGLRFGRWLVLQYAGVRGRNHRWICVCDCGRKKEIWGSALKNGSSQSCGCLQKEIASKNLREIRLKHGMTGTPEYQSWNHMKQRCYNTNDHKYPHYGGRGISVCKRWIESFENFFEDMGTRPSSEYSLGRINNDGDYRPENCRWETAKQQERNTTRNRLLTLGGISLCLSEWAECTGLNRTTIERRIDSYGWTVKRALTTSVARKQR